MYYTALQLLYLFLATRFDIFGFRVHKIEVFLVLPLRHLCIPGFRFQFFGFRFRVDCTVHSMLEALFVFLVSHLYISGFRDRVIEALFICPSNRYRGFVFRSQVFDWLFLVYLTGL